MALPGGANCALQVSIKINSKATAASVAASASIKINWDRQNARSAQKEQKRWVEVHYLSWSAVAGKDTLRQPEMRPQQFRSATCAKMA